MHYFIEVFSILRLRVAGCLRAGPHFLYFWLKALSGFGRKLLKQADILVFHFEHIGLGERIHTAKKTAYKRRCGDFLVIF